MNPLWHAEYPQSIPTTVDVAPFASLTQLLSHSMARYAAQTAISSMGKDTSFLELDLMATRFASWLQSKGIGKGDRVAVMMPNVMPFAVALIGTLRVGGVVVTVNPQYTPRELAHQLNDSGAKVLVLFEAFAATAAAVLENSAIEHVVVAGSGLAGRQTAPITGQIGFLQTLQIGALHPFTPVQTVGSDLAFLQYTGGTTGVSKGAMLSHANIMANVMQISAWLRPAFPDVGLEGKSIASFLPLYHIFALSCSLLLSLQNGMRNLFVANPRDPQLAAMELGGRPIHVLPGVNTLFAGFALNPKLKSDLNLNELRIAIAGGMPVQQGVAERWLQTTGVPICEGYGLSESSPVVACNLVTDQDWSGTAGLPIPNTDIEIRNDNGDTLPQGERGEICIRGPQLMRGYWQRPEETTHAMTVDGFFKTGDIGFFTERGQLKIVDRKKDMILVSGFNVFPAELEDVISTLPGVMESAAVGVPDAKSGEAVKLFIVRRDESLSEEMVREHCRIHLTAYKNPKAIAFVPSLPKSNVGKVLRRELREPA